MNNASATSKRRPGKGVPLLIGLIFAITITITITITIIIRNEPGRREKLLARAGWEGSALAL
jgi:hypothetical protein